MLQQRMTATLPVQIEASVIGRNCHIGRGAHITGCYLLDNVHVGDQAQISHSLLCDGVSVGAHAMVFPGSVLSFKADFLCTLAFHANRKGKKFLRWALLQQGLQVQCLEVLNDECRSTACLKQAFEGSARCR